LFGLALGLDRGSGNLFEVPVLAGPVFDGLLKILGDGSDDLVAALAPATSSARRPTPPRLEPGEVAGADQRLDHPVDRALERERVVCCAHWTTFGRWQAILTLRGSSGRPAVVTTTRIWIVGRRMIAALDAFEQPGDLVGLGF
jgi:hypothetical protein